MARIDAERTKQLVGAAERALTDNGYAFTKLKFKHYAIEKDGVRQRIILRTSADRWVGLQLL